MFLAEDEKYEYERDDRPMVKARITVTFNIYVEIPDFDPDLVDPDPMLEQAVKEYEYKAEDISNWEFDEYV